jgi:hypothetical protein
MFLVSFGALSILLTSLQQDWAPVTLTKNRPTGKVASSQQAINEAKRKGLDVEVEKKWTILLLCHEFFSR